MSVAHGASLKRLLLAFDLTPVVTIVAAAPEITAFSIGALGSENLQERATSTQCYCAKIEAALGVLVKAFTLADHGGDIQGLLGGILDLT